MEYTVKYKCTNCGNTGELTIDENDDEDFDISGIDCDECGEETLEEIE